MVRAEVKIGDPQKKILDHKFFFQTLGQKLRPRSFKWRPLFALFQGGGCKRWYFGQICAPVTTPLRAAAPLAPPLATALTIVMCYVCSGVSNIHPTARL
jgi:hypothetical protein